MGLGQDRSYFIENFAMLLIAGMDIVPALESIKSGLKSKRMKIIIEELKQEIDSGNPVWKALDNTGIMSAHSISLVKIGEESGRLAINLRVISSQDEKERIFRSKLTSAMLYPTVVLFFTLVVGIGIAWFILPKLTGVFSSLNINLPVTTKMLLAFGSFLSNYGIYAVPAFFAVLLVIFYFLFSFKSTKFIGQKLIFTVPGIRTLIQQIELSKFGFILGSLLKAGMPLVECLKSLEEISSFISYKKFYVYLQKQVNDGQSFKNCFTDFPHAERLVPYPIQQMIVASEQSGNLQESFADIGRTFEEKSDISTKNLATIVEPILLFVIWGVVVFVALSVIMPLYGLLGGLNK